MTKYSCSGHLEKDDVYIMFHDDVNYEKFISVATQLARAVAAKDLRIYYYVRNNKYRDRTKIGYNWTIRSNGFKTHSERLRIIDEVTDFFKKGVNIDCAT